MNQSDRQEFALMLRQAPNLLESSVDLVVLGLTPEGPKPLTEEHKKLHKLGRLIIEPICLN